MNILINSFLDEIEKLANRAGGGYFGSTGAALGGSAGGGTGSIGGRGVGFPGGGTGSSLGYGTPGIKAMPSFDKGGVIKSDGYLTDEKGKPYARVHKGERVLPKALVDKLR